MHVRAQDAAKDPQAYVRNVAQIELAAHAHPAPRWQYLLEKRNAGGATTREIIETREGLVARLLTLNGQPLTAQVQRDEFARLRALQNDPSQISKKLAGQERDRERVLKMIRALPDAFLYAYDGTTSGPFGDEVRFSYKPNPRFSPDSVETQILRSMSGTLRIASKQQRLIELRGTLTSDVSIGLGILGRVSKGGTLLLAQSQLGPDSWEVTTLDLNVTGRALFRTLDVSVYEHLTEFRPISPAMSAQQAIDLLLQMPTASGRNNLRAASMHDLYAQ